uniref:Uncharacterized protein n=1 Tax=Mycena chlorophos TaxID=658473 RepID=A0ABQ0KXU5_MYCCL|nr:predicted protein [Mycena chlorophos]
MSQPTASLIQNVLRALNPPPDGSSDCPVGGFHDIRYIQGDKEDSRDDIGQCRVWCTAAVPCKPNPKLKDLAPELIETARLAVRKARATMENNGTEVSDTEAVSDDEVDGFLSVTSFDKYNRKQFVLSKADRRTISLVAFLQSGVEPKVFKIDIRALSAFNFAELEIAEAFGAVDGQGHTVRAFELYHVLEQCWEDAHTAVNLKRNGEFLLVRPVGRNDTACVGLSTWIERAMNSALDHAIAVGTIPPSPKKPVVAIPARLQPQPFPMDLPAQAKKGGNGGAQAEGSSQRQSKRKGDEVGSEETGHEKLKRAKTDPEIIELEDSD